MEVKKITRFLLVLGFFFVSSLGAEAAIPMPEMLKKANPGEEVAPFFKTLDPKTSSRGAVRSFAVTVVSFRKPRKVLPEITQVVRFEVVKGKLIVPVNGRLTSLFGYRRHPSRRSRHFHTGLDISARHGTPIIAAAGGEVTYSGWRSGYGKMLEVRHANGLSTIYAHCSSLLKKVGDQVRGGAVIARVGRTGVTTGCHLHFEVKKGSMLVNPLRFLPL